jgi:uroporphyrinogen III methyltransferase/synthase
VKVVLTGTGQQDLAESLRAEGFDVERCPLVRIEPLEGPPIRVDEYDWLVLTSRNAVEALFARVVGPLPRVAAIGPGTAKALRARGVEPELVASESTQEGLAAELPKPSGRVVFAGAEGAREVLARELGADFVPLYRTLELEPDGFPEADLVVVASASAARALARLRRDLRCVSIGPVTSAEARGAGLDVVAEAETHDARGVLVAVKLAASQRDSSRS